MARNITKTFSATPKDITRKWYVVDATDLILGRMSVVIADYLRGKHKVYTLQIWIVVITLLL